MKEEYYLTHASGYCVSAYTGDIKTPFFPESPAIKFADVKEALDVLCKIIQYYGLDSAVIKDFNIIPTSEAKHVVNAN